MDRKKNAGVGGERRGQVAREARARRHGRWWREILELIAVKTGPARRSVQAQMARRRLERDVKLAVLGLVRLCRIRGQSWATIAARVRIAAETLRGWMRQWRCDRLVASARGRPLSRSRREVRNQVFAALGLIGATTPLVTLRELFPMIGRRELEDLLARYRRVRRQRGVLLHEVTWKNDGVVWAMDFTEAPTAVDARYPYVLVVRDLGSGKLLLSLPAVEQTAAVVCDALRALFREHGAPLVLKSDNGSGFIAADTHALLDDHGVLPLLSPPSTPRFNGACEAGIGGLKVRAHYEAARHGRPGEWTCDDVETARLVANAIARPRGATGPSPDDLWSTRSRPADRAATCQLLIERVQECTTEERERVSSDAGREPQRHIEAAVARIALCRALVQLGYLQLRRRRFTLPIESRRRSINS